MDDKSDWLVQPTAARKLTKNRKRHCRTLVLVPLHWLITSFLFLCFLSYLWIQCIFLPEPVLFSFVLLIPDMGPMSELAGLVKCSYGDMRTRACLHFFLWTKHTLTHYVSNLNIYFWCYSPYMRHLLYIRPPQGGGFLLTRVEGLRTRGTTPQTVGSSEAKIASWRWAVTI